jgi:translation initiation factor 3 subunit D
MNNFRYVSRLHSKEPNAHEILGVETYKPYDFLTQLDLDIHNAWGIVKVFVDMLLALPEGEYVMAKDSSKAGLKIVKQE